MDKLALIIDNAKVVIAILIAMMLYLPPAAGLMRVNSAQETTIATPQPLKMSAHLTPANSQLLEAAPPIVTVHRLNTVTVPLDAQTSKTLTHRAPTTNNAKVSA